MACAWHGRTQAQEQAEMNRLRMEREKKEKLRQMAEEAERKAEEVITLIS